MAVLYATSDLHGNLPEIPSDADALIIAGDVCPDFAVSGALTKDGFAQAHWLKTKLGPWLEDSRVAVALIIWGNHDFVGENYRLWRPALPHNARVIQDEETDLCGLRIYGTPWVPNLPQWAFYARLEALYDRAEVIPPGLDILISHGPPYGLGDYIPTGSSSGEHVGDPALRERLYLLQEGAPKITVCGHIHEARGYHSTESGLTVLNASAVDEKYNLHKHAWWRLYDVE